MVYKKITAYILAVVLLLGSGKGVMAQEYPDNGEITFEHSQEQKAFEEEMAKIQIMPFWAYAITVDAYLSINKSTGIASCSYNVVTYNSINQINAYVYLQRLNTTTYLWGNVENWSKSHYTFTGESNFKKTLTLTGNYRTKVTVYLYKNGTPVENVTSYSETKTL